MSFGCTTAERLNFPANEQDNVKTLGNHLPRPPHPACTKSILQRIHILVPWIILFRLNMIACTTVDHFAVTLAENFLLPVGRRRLTGPGGNFCCLRCCWLHSINRKGEVYSSHHRRIPVHRFMVGSRMADMVQEYSCRQRRRRRKRKKNWMMKRKLLD